MRALVLGARGAVGRAIVAELRGQGHHVTPAGRARADDAARIDLTTLDGLTELQRAAAGHDVIINATGVEDPRIVRSLAGTVLVDISASASYLDELARCAPASAGIVLGAGLVPGLSTVLVAALETAPGDDVDLAITLGGGETHGTAAVEWIAGLAGQPMYQPPEGATVLNLRERRRLHGPHGARWHLRADFPDHVLVGVSHGLAVRSYLAIDSRVATAALALVGRAPGLRGLIRHAPHLGGSRWNLTATNRRTGRSLTAHGQGQSRVTGLLAARTAAIAAQRQPDVPVSTAELLTLRDLDPLPEIAIQAG